MIESVDKTDAPVFTISSKNNNTKAFDKSAASKPQANDLSGEDPAVSSSKHSVENPSANTHQEDSHNASLKDLLRQRHNSDSATYTAESKLLKVIQDTTQRLNTSENSLIGLDKIIEKFKTSAQFNSVDIDKVAQNMKDKNMSLELGFYSLSYVLEKRAKALKGGHVDTEPDVAAYLLEHPKENTVEGTVQAQENIAEDKTQNAATNLAERIAKLLSEDNEKQLIDAQKSNGILAKLKEHMAKMTKLHEEELSYEKELSGKTAD